MAIYAVGDVQGCYDQLRQLLDKLNFDRNHDTLWLTGDLVNRGPKSLKTLRYVKKLGKAAVTVLGNHDLHLLSVYNKHHSLKTSPDFTNILKAKDSDELIHWLRHQPLMHHDQELNTVLVHAGLAPQWSLTEAQQCAREFELVLKRRDYSLFLPSMYGNTPNLWSDELEGAERLRFTVNAFTRMRFCDQKGALTFTDKNNPNKAPAHLLPWFKVNKRKNRDVRIIFGHWSTLGYMNDENLIALDTGCVWGGELTAIRIDQKNSKPVSVKHSA